MDPKKFLRGVIHCTYARLRPLQDRELGLNRSRVAVVPLWDIILLHPLNGQPFASFRPYICASGDFTLFRVWPGYDLFPCFCEEAQNLSDVSGTPYELRSLNRVPRAYLMKPGFWIHQKIDRFSRI
ncbi:hypothetical protein Agabi119p4_2363 [Agaricus bisporus var. burnettii]|uniref:Uncharacterized protein n=1 Tax=Agaricus bisporus var. burnettii TaxID=192524 RepID=A0A8H7KK33_AGABI|nr:hypothetical protein Agabi119p4_2363 [Agaricus bisporus var. burnettii]